MNGYKSRYGQDVMKRAKRLLVVVLLCFSGTGCSIANGSQPEGFAMGLHTFDVQLVGATEYGTVQLFSCLMEEVPGVTEVKAITLELDPNDPQRCRMQWQVKTHDRNVESFIGEFFEKIAAFDLKASNTLGCRSLPRVTSGDFAQVKKVFLRQALGNSMLYVVSGCSLPYAGAESVTANRWLEVPGAGFE